MFIDQLQLVSDAQAFGAAAVSTNSIDLGTSVPKRQIGTGEPMGFAFQIDVGATVAAPIVEIISATDAGLTAGIISHASMTIALATAVAGFLAFIGLPLGTPTQRFLGIRVTTAGGTITATSWLSPQSMFSIQPVVYPKAFTA